MQGNETDIRRDDDPAPVDPRIAQQKEAVRQMEAEGFMAADDETAASPPTAAGTPLARP